MSDVEQNEQRTDGKKKISLEEAIRQKLASKQQGQTAGNANKGIVKSTKALKSQQTKKVNNQRKRMGV